MNANHPNLVYSGTYASTHRIEVNGVSYLYSVRDGKIGQIRVEANGARGGLKWGSKRYNEVLAHIHAAVA